MTIREASFSERGARPSNQDRYGSVSSPSGRAQAWMVADGLGGQAGGDLAAELAVAAAIDAFRKASPDRSLDDLVGDCLEAAAAAVVAGRDNPAYPRMGSTIVVLVAGGETVCWGHSGDSRLYRLRADGAEQLTADHSLAEAFRRLTGNAPEAGSSAQDRGGASHVLVSCLGEADPMLAVSSVQPLRPGDCFLLCSDGLWEHWTEDALADLAKLPFVEMLEHLAARVVEADDPEQDNYTAVLVAPQPSLKAWVKFLQSSAWWRRQS